MPFSLEILIVLVLLIANGVLAMSEIAVVSSRKTRLQQLASTGNKGARTALKLANDPSQFLSTVQIGISLVGVLAGAFGGATIAEKLEVYLISIPRIAPYAEGLSVTIVVLVITYFSLVIGELVPKRLALTNAENIAAIVSRPMLLLSKVTYPLVRVLSVSTNAVLKLLGKDAPARETITEDEIKIMIDQATEAGVVMETEQDMIEGVLALGDLQANELMTPRHDMVVLDANDPPEENWEKVFESGHTYFPVVDGDLSRILGLTSIKTLCEAVVRGKPMDLRAALTPPLFVPETVPALKIFEKFKAHKSHIAFVVDEYGGIEGLVPITDLLEAVVGDIPSITGEDEEEIVRREDGSWLIDGRVPIEKLKQLLKIKRLPKKHAGDYNTVGGFVMAQLDRVPKTSDHFTWRGYRFEVVDMDRHRVDKILVARVPTDAAAKKKPKTPPGRSAT